MRRMLCGGRGAQPLVVSNLGAQALTISGVSLGGAQAGDFTVVSDGCARRRLAFAQTCTVSVRFTPAAAGARSATLGLVDNEAIPSSVALSGTGVAPNSGPAGATGPVGPTGPSGTAGSVRLVTCTTRTKTVTSHGHKHTVKVQKCTTHLVKGTATFTTAGGRATLARDGVVYATGTATRGRVVLHARRALARGRYLLILRRRVGRRWVITRQAITLG